VVQEAGDGVQHFYGDMTLQFVIMRESLAVVYRGTQMAVWAVEEKLLPWAKARSELLRSVQGAAEALGSNKKLVYDLKIQNMFGTMAIEAGKRTMPMAQAVLAHTLPLSRQVNMAIQIGGDLVSHVQTQKEADWLVTTECESERRENEGQCKTPMIFDPAYIAQAVEKLEVDFKKRVMEVVELKQRREYQGTYGVEPVKGS
jgi:hypothetical protein